MKLLLYSNGRRSDAHWIKELTATISEESGFRHVTSAVDLLRELKAPCCADDIVVIQVSDLPELKQMVALKDFLTGRRLILVLSEICQDQIAWGHRLHPRYLMGPGTPAEWLADIIRRMIRRTAGEAQGFGGEEVSQPAAP